MQFQGHPSMIQLNRFSQLFAFYLQTESKSSQFGSQNLNQRRFVIQKQLLREIYCLKNNIKKLLKSYESLQNQSKVLKRMITRSNDSFSTYSNQMSSKSTLTYENSQFKKYPFGVSNSSFSPKIQNIHIEQNSIEKNIYNSSSHFQRLRMQVIGLTENLKSMTKAYEKYELDSTNDNQNRDMFFNQSSLLQFDSKNVNFDGQSSSKENIDLQNLLCDEQLSFDPLPSEQRSFQKVCNEQNMVDSLIAKGIEFRQSRTLRSKQYQTLSSTIKKYREEFKNIQKLSDSETQFISKYR